MLTLFTDISSPSIPLNETFVPTLGLVDHIGEYPQTSQGTVSIAMGSQMSTNIAEVPLQTPKPLDPISDIHDGEETSTFFSPTSCKKSQRKTEKSRVEKLMEEQISASTKLVTVTECLLNELTAMNQLKQKENELLYRLVVAKEEEVSYKRMKYT